MTDWRKFARDPQLVPEQLFETLLEAYDNDIGQRHLALKPIQDRVVEDCSRLVSTIQKAARNRDSEALSQLRKERETAEKEVGPLIEELELANRLAVVSKRRYTRFKTLAMLISPALLALALAGALLVDLRLAAWIEMAFNVVVPSIPKVVSVVVVFFLTALVVERPLEKLRYNTTWSLYLSLCDEYDRAMEELDTLEAQLRKLDKQGSDA